VRRGLLRAVSDARLVITFGADVDLDLLREALAIEPDGCSFFTLDYDTQRWPRPTVSRPPPQATTSAIRRRRWAWEANR
jgi:hypothetical protein